MFQYWYQTVMEMSGEDIVGVLLYHTGSFAGAVSGIRLASAKKFDWFGAYVVGFTTAIGGGTLRDLLLQTHPFWMDDPSYLFTTFFAQIMMWIFGRRFISEKVTWFVFDTVSISVFMVIGLEKTLGAGFSCPIAIVMGVITAVFGGVLRDVLINEVPLIFRKELYAMACAAGGGLYIILIDSGAGKNVAGIVCIVAIFVLRALAIRYGWGVPVLGRRGFMHESHFDGRHHRRVRDRAIDARRETDMGR